MKKIILHIDLDAFFCRCEEIKNPILVDKPFSVGGDGRRGIVSTCSYAARKYGIKSGMPTFQAKMLCKNLIIIPGDYKYYSLMSKEFFNYLKVYSTKIETMSIDECFLDLTDYYLKSKKDIMDILKEIQEGLFKKTQLKCSIGVGTTKFIAKMASDYKKPLGITIIRNKDIEQMLFPLPIKDFFGIGKKTQPKLKAVGINTIGDLYYACKQNNKHLEETIGSFKDHICNLLEGNSDDDVEAHIYDPKSISMSRTLDRDTNDSRIIQEYLENEVQKVVNSLIKEDKLCKTIVISYKDAQFEGEFKAKSFSKTLDEFTNSKDLLLKQAVKLFNETYDGKTIRLIGFAVKNLKDKHEIVTQMTFDNYERHEEESTSFLVINELNREYHKPIFKRLSDIVKDKK